MNNEDNKITAATISTKHLDNFASGRQLGKTYITKLAHQAANQIDVENVPRVYMIPSGHLQLNLNPPDPVVFPNVGRGMTRPSMFFGDSEPFFEYWHSAFRYKQLRKDLHKKMFGCSRDVWDRFARAFHSWAPEYLHLKTRIKPIESYWSRDWLTNVVAPRVNQYDPVDYYKYCERLRYSPDPFRSWAKRGFYTGPRLVTTWSASGVSLYDPFPIDDRAKEMLAQLIPATYHAAKRIY